MDIKLIGENLIQAPMKKILVSWIGHTDLLAMIPTLSESQVERVRTIVLDKAHGRAGLGPIKTLLQQEHFDEVCLIDNYAAKDVLQWYSQWLGCKPHIITVAVNNPADYEEVFRISDSVLAEVCSRQKKSKEFSLSLLLTSGTPTMAAVFVLLGKTKYPAFFWQTHLGMATETRIPYDLTSDLLPDLLHNSDSAFHHLSALSPQEIQGFENIIGDSPAIRLAVGRARLVAIRDVSVLLTGESGTGKELFAHAIHAASCRKGKPFKAVNCAAFPDSLIEGELFGYEKGAFTGADQPRDGLFKQADGGTLFLDEIGECPLPQQAKLLRVLQPPHGTPPSCREFERIGGKEKIRSDVRIIAATNRDLAKEVAEGRFREDLYYRLASFLIKLPPLRERRSDIIPIAESILQRINEDFGDVEQGYEPKNLSVSAKKFVRSFDWPGNVRQLSNVLLQAAILSQGVSIGKAELEEGVSGTLNFGSAAIPPLLPLGEGFSLDAYLKTIRERYLREAMKEANGVKAEAARLLGYQNAETLRRQLETHEIRWEGEK